jgi:hypothetical protein
MTKILKKAPRHAFKFKVQTGEGETPKVLTAWADVRRARKPVELILTADDVRRSIALKGVGNTQTCSMAVCSKRQADKFPHPVQGYIDWQYRTAFVVSKVSAETGLSVACVAYEHRDSIAKLNDTKGGQQKLLTQLEADGDRVIRLNPIKYRERPKGRAKGKKDGSRGSRPAAVGANLRFAVAQLGGIAA